MFNKFELTVGLRYLKAKQKNSFVSFISLISIIGITLGVAALITVLSVMNGFQGEIRNKIIGVTAHMRIMDASGSVHNWVDAATTAKNTYPFQVVAAAPYVEGQALVTFDNNVSGVMVRGIDPHLEASVEDVGQHMVLGSSSSLTAGSFNVIIGEVLARSLGVDVGDKITVLTPDVGQTTPVGIMPRFKRFTVSGIFNVHMYEYDSSLILIDLRDASVLFKLDNGVTGVRLKVVDVMQTAEIKQGLLRNLSGNYIVSDWIDQYQNYFAAVALEKKMMFIILVLIVAVAAFNLVSTLVMTVNEKTSDIAILRTMGASKKNIRNIFIIQGAVSGIIGAVSGTILGVILATYVGKIVHFIETITGQEIVRGSIYLIDYLPSQIIFRDVFSVFLIAVLLSILATIYPSRNAANINPVEALRYE